MRGKRRHSPVIERAAAAHGLDAVFTLGRRGSTTTPVVSTDIAVLVANCKRASGDLQAVEDSLLAHVDVRPGAHVESVAAAEALAPRPAPAADERARDCGRSA